MLHPLSSCSIRYLFRYTSLLTSTTLEDHSVRNICHAISAMMSGLKAATVYRPHSSGLALYELLAGRSALTSGGV